MTFTILGFRVGLRIDDVDTGRAQTGYNEVTALGVRVGRIGAEAGAAGVPAKVMQLIAGMLSPTSKTSARSLPNHIKAALCRTRPAGGVNHEFFCGLLLLHRLDPAPDEVVQGLLKERPDLRASARSLAATSSSSVSVVRIS